MANELAELLASVKLSPEGSAAKNSAAALLENAEAARATKQEDRALDYLNEALKLTGECFGDDKGARDKILSSLDGTQDKVMALMEGGEALEEALDVLVTEAQALLLRGEAHMDKGQAKQALADLDAAEALSRKLCDDAAVSRCLRSRGMLCLMRKEVTKAEDLLTQAVAICRQAGESKEEAATLKLLIDLYKGRANMYDRVCELFHELLEALSSEEDTTGVNTALLQLGQFRLQKHLADTSNDSELVFAELEMTDMDLGGALDFFAAQVSEDASEGPEEVGEDGPAESPVQRYAEALTAMGTIKMLLGEQLASTDSLAKAVEMYRRCGDEEGEARASGLLGDVKRIMDKVDSTSVTPIN